MNAPVPDWREFGEGAFEWGSASVANFLLENMTRRPNKPSVLHTLRTSQLPFLIDGLIRQHSLRSVTTLQVTHFRPEAFPQFMRDCMPLLRSTLSSLVLGFTEDYQPMGTSQYNGSTERSAVNTIGLCHEPPMEMVSLQSIRFPEAGPCAQAFLSLITAPFISSLVYSVHGIQVFDAMAAVLFLNRCTESNKRPRNMPAPVNTRVCFINLSSLRQFLILF